MVTTGFRRRLVWPFDVSARQYNLHCENAAESWLLRTCAYIYAPHPYTEWRIRGVDCKAPRFDHSVLHAQGDQARAAKLVPNTLTPFFDQVNAEHGLPSSCVHAAPVTICKHTCIGQVGCVGAVWAQGVGQG